MDKTTIIIIIVIVLLVLSSLGLFILNLVSSSGDYQLSPLYLIQYGINQIKIYAQETISFLTAETVAPIIPSNFVKKYPYLKQPQANRLTHPFTASAIIDIDNSNKDSVFVGGGEGQDDVLLSYSEKDKQMVNIIQNTNLSDKVAASYCATSIDINNNGYMDLIVGRSNGLFVYVNNKDGTFSKKKIYEANDADVVAIAVGDYNKSGLPSLYLSMFTPSPKLKAFQFNNDNHWRKNVMLRNNGNLEFSDVTEETNTFGSQNTFTSAFVDFGSGNPDLVLANDTGKVEILKNVGKKYESINLDTPYGFWMGVAIGDYNNNGKLDLFFTNVGNTLPVTETGGIKGYPNKGGIKEGQVLTNKHLMLQNEGNYQFTNVSDTTNVNDNGFGWGCQFEDINLDGKLDLAFAQNYLDMPTTPYLPGTVLLGYTKDAKTTFTKTTKYPNTHYGHTPLFADLTGSGTKELIWINMIGPAIIYSTESDNDYISVRLPNNIEFLNATVTLLTDKGQQVRQNICGGLGFGSGSGSYQMQFGLDKEGDKSQSVPMELLVKTIYGEEIQILKPEINKKYIIGYDKSFKLG